MEALLDLLLPLLFCWFYKSNIYSHMCRLGYYIGKTGEDKYFVSKALRKIKNKIFPPRIMVVLNNCEKFIVE